MKRISLTLLICFSAVLAVAANSDASIVLVYDSQSGGLNNQLDQISGFTNSTYVGAGTSTSTIRGGQTDYTQTQAVQNATVRYGDQGDMQFRFGRNIAAPITGSLIDSVNNGLWIGFNYTAARDQTIDRFRYDLFVNSQSNNNAGARDSGLFYRINGGAFTQFGAPQLFGNNGDKGTLELNGSFDILAGDVVNFRLAFTDRTNTAANLQAATRLGSFELSAIPEPSSFAMFSILGFLGFRRRR